MNTRFYNGRVLEEVCKAIHAKTGIDVFPDHRPSNVGKDMKAFIVVQIYNNLGDQNVQQQYRILFNIYARTRANGVAWVGKLQEITDTLSEMFPFVAPDKRYNIFWPRLLRNGYDGVDFTIWTLSSTLIVNTTDKF